MSPLLFWVFSFMGEIYAPLRQEPISSDAEVAIRYTNLTVKVQYPQDMGGLMVGVSRVGPENPDQLSSQMYNYR